MPKTTNHRASLVRRNADSVPSTVDQSSPTSARSAVPTNHTARVSTCGDDGNVDRGTCSKCGGENLRSPQAYCHECHAAYMRANRRRHGELTDLARKKANCRSYTKVLVERGHLTRLPCEVCGTDEVQAHHPDYDNPRLVLWLCVPCHLQHHQDEAAPVPALVSPEQLESRRARIARIEAARARASDVARDLDARCAEAR